MWRYTYGRPRRNNFSSRYNNGRYNRYSRSRPWYTAPRSRPRASERDRAFWVDLNDNNDDRYPRHRPREVVEINRPEIPPAELAKGLHVKSVDLHIDTNAEAHHTDDYECNDKRTREKEDGSVEHMKPELVIRRGQDFQMTITFDRPFNVKRNDISLTFNLGDGYKPNKDLSATFYVKEPGESTNYKPKRWGATVVGQKGHSLTISVFVPATVSIGEWEFSIACKVDGVTEPRQYNHNEDINIIFNPWCKEDWVYLEDDTWRNEVVLNDKGVQYYGSFRSIGCRTWDFGQFDDGILDAAFHLVRKSFGGRAAPAMGNAASIARNLSQLVNSNDDYGVLQGKWGKPYTGGTKPTVWNGSVQILRDYMKYKKPVKYGQCWVFSGVLTTVCRALGLPCRSVTNYSSAHNTDKDDLTIDYLWAVDDYESESGDSVWNFHVWNEVWMRRPDLDEDGKWDGWQVIDATPQETSDNVFRCGPAPVKAIKEGEITVGKDGDFIFAEVNGDKVYRSEIGGRLRVDKRDKDAVGKNISTHQPTGKGFRGETWRGNKERLDLTDAYKYPESSKQERQIFKKATRKIKLVNSGNDNVSDSEEEEVPERVAIKIEDPGDVFVGSSFDFVVHVKNVTTSAVAVKDVELKVYYKSYTGSHSGLATTKKSGNIKLDPGKAQTMQIHMNNKIIADRPDESFIFELIAVASFHDSSEHVSEGFTFRMRRADVILKGPSTCGLFETIEIEARFTNPFSDRDLTNCEIEMSGGFYWVDPRKNRFRIRNIGREQTWRQMISVRPRWYPRTNKERQLNLTFDSNELEEIVGSCSVVIRDR